MASHHSSSPTKWEKQSTSHTTGVFASPTPAQLSLTLFASGCFLSMLVSFGSFFLPFLHLPSDLLQCCRCRFGANESFLAFCFSNQNFQVRPSLWQLNITSQCIPSVTPPCQLAVLSLLLFQTAEVLRSAGYLTLPSWSFHTYIVKSVYDLEVGGNYIGLRETINNLIVGKMTRSQESNTEHFLDPIIVRRESDASSL